MAARGLVAVDMGGTWIRAALVHPEGACGEVVRRPTDRRRPASAIIEDLAAAILRAAGGTVSEVAIGVPTVVDERGRLARCDNLPTMGGVELARELGARLAASVALHNDALCFAAGEWWKGAGRGTRTFCGITLGTGIGLGLVLDEGIHRGAHGMAGEIWKTPFEGGTLEDRLCGRAIEAAFRAQTGRTLPPEEVAALGASGDPPALRVFEEFGRTLGKAVCFIVNLLDPEVVAFGGSVCGSYELFRRPLEETVLDGTVGAGRTALRRTVLGETATLLGAAKLYWEREA